MTDIATNFHGQSSIEFMGGFIYGMTGINHLDTLATCDYGAVDLYLIYNYAEMTIEYLKQGDEKDAIRAAEFGVAVIGYFPKAIHACENIGDDVAEIEAWAKIFAEPKKLAKTVTHNYLFHSSEIKSDITAVKADWNQDLSFKSGMDLADLVTIAVGPMTPPSSDNGIDLPPIAAVPDFTAGLIFGFTGNDHRVELEGCMTDISPIVDDAKAFLSDLKHFNPIHVVEDIGDIVWILPEAVKSCGELEALQTDLAVIEAWALQLEQPTKVAKIAGKNWLFHGTHIKKDVSTEEADWSSGDYYGAGKATADAMITLVPEGSVNESAEYIQ